MIHFFESPVRVLVKSDIQVDPVELMVLFPFNVYPVHTGYVHLSMLYASTAVRIDLRSVALHESRARAW